MTFITDYEACLMPPEFDEGVYDDLPFTISRDGILQCGTIGDHKASYEINAVIDQYEKSSRAYRDGFAKREESKRRRQKVVEAKRYAEWRLKNADKIAAQEAAEASRQALIQSAIAGAEQDIVKLYFNDPANAIPYIAAQMFHAGIAITAGQIRDVLTKHGLG